MENKMATFEIKILCKTFGPVKKDETWQKRINFELFNIYDETDVIATIKINKFDDKNNIITRLYLIDIMFVCI